MIRERNIIDIRYIIDHIPKNTPNNRRPSHSMYATSITIHNTGNPRSTARNERNWLINSANDRTASYHIVVDEHRAIECIPLNENAWHAGDGSSITSGNRTSIGIEICESGDYEKTIRNAAELVAILLMERGWDIERLRRHFDWSGKICPRLMYDGGKWTGWLEFKSRVADQLQRKGGERMLKAEDANKIIPFISAAYMATEDSESRKEFNRLANELRTASGQPKQ